MGRKRDRGGQRGEVGVKVLGESGAPSPGVAWEQSVGPGGLESVAKSPEVLPGMHLGIARGLGGNGFTLIKWGSSVPPI